MVCAKVEVWSRDVAQQLMSPRLCVVEGYTTIKVFMEGVWWWLWLSSGLRLCFGCRCWSSDTPPIMEA